MEVLHDIAEAEHFLAAVPGSTEYLAIARAQALAKRCSSRSKLEAWVRDAAADELQIQAWHTASQDWEARLQAARLAWLAHTDDLSADVLAALEQVVPQLYDKFLDAVCDSSEAATATQLQQQVRDVEEELSQAKAGAAADRSIDDTLLEQLESSEAEGKRLAAAHAALQRQISETVQRQQGEVERVTQQLHEVRAAAQAHEARVLELEDECTALCKELDDAQAQNASLLARNDDLSGEVEAALQRLQAQAVDAKRACNTADIGNGCARIRTPRTEPDSAPDDQERRAASPRSASNPQSSKVPVQPNSSEAAASVALRLPSSPAKRAAKAVSPTDSVLASPLKKHAHSFGIGGQGAKPQHQSRGIAVPRSLWDTARDHSSQSAQTTPRSSELADVPLSQQPSVSRSSALRTYSVSPTGRFGRAPRVPATEHLRKPDVTHQAVQCVPALVRDAATQCDDEGAGSAVRPLPGVQPALSRDANRRYQGVLTFSLPQLFVISICRGTSHRNLHEQLTSSGSGLATCC
jgi:hypothetical protein